MPPPFQGNADQQTGKRTGPYSRIVAEGPDGLEPDPILVNPDHQKDGEGSKPSPANLVRGQTQLVVAVASAILAGLLEYQKYRRAGTRCNLPYSEGRPEDFRCAWAARRSERSRSIFWRMSRERAS